MKISASPLAVVLACLSLVASARARETVLVIGDSLSREYQFEFAQFEEARNWVELLAEFRPDDFFFGPLESSDLGLLADACDLFSLDNAVCNAIGDDGTLERYRYNWAIPTYSAEDYAGDLTGGSLFQGFFQELILDDFEDVSAVVVFIGGNDIDSVYSSIYNGNTSQTNSIIDRIEGDLEDIIDFVLDDSPALRMILVNVPHVGATPEVKADHPTDPVKTGRVTSALQTLDGRLRDLADRKGIGYADILTLTVDLLPDDPFCIGGFPFTNAGSDSGAREFIWLGGELSQNFHPNTNGQAIVANAIIAGFNERYGIGAELFSEREIVEDILGLQGPFSAWADLSGLAAGQRDPSDDPDGDGLNNLIEFTLDLIPTEFSQLPSPSLLDGDLVLEFGVRPQACEVTTVTPQWSTDLSRWEDVPAASIQQVSPEAFRVSMPPQGSSTFLRLLVTGS